MLEPKIEENLSKYFSLLIGKDEDDRIISLPKKIICVKDLMDNHGDFIFEKGKTYVLRKGYSGFDFYVEGEGCEYLFKNAKEVRENFTFCGTVNKR